MKTVLIRLITKINPELMNKLRSHWSRIFLKGQSKCKISDITTRRKGVPVLSYWESFDKF